ncbi:MFS general substrate transporter [Fragilariopsis cylindrus CCMP1102]|uniref:MFS general substrate transporter n=1 Tax=Fragilariopsis cylindrus CCMP1102 TaxID=635003 RepID=A0A1E7FX31_9STRA|nr:MFS general substrate transporter [Fragilariopsis cylindrus CCMP1102]|eukprot:OEU22696.1 MFS general substrate transporter [Fragilariopsis cylindrus CCMP1102]
MPVLKNDHKVKKEGRDNKDDTAASAKKKASEKGFLYGTLSLGLLVTAGSVVMGFSQSRRDAMGCDVQCIGKMTSSRSTLALLGSTIIGKCSDSKKLDKLGGARRCFLILGIVASGFQLLFSFQSTNIDTLWMSMIPAALFQQNFTILKALFLEYHDEYASAAERAGSVGKLGMAAGLAFMVGPLMGSVLFEEYRSAAIFAACCLLGALFFTLLLPRPNSSDEEDTTKKSPTSSVLSFRHFIPDLVPVARTPPAIFIMTSRICMALAFHIFQTIWAVALKERFNFGQKEYGQYYAFIGFVFAISQGFLAKYLLKHFGDSDKDRTKLLLTCAVLLGGGRFIVYQTHSIVVVYTVFGLIITALGVINTIFTADTSNIASSSELGGLFGILGSMESLAGISGPILGGMLARIHPVQGPLIAVLFLYGVVFTLIYFGYEKIICQGKTIRNSNKKSKEE